MDLIIDFYKELDTLNLIIFWGIIIVIILLLIFSFILMNKNKKLKRIVEKQNKNEAEIPIKREELIQEVAIENKIKKENEDQQEKTKNENSMQNTIETEKNFVAEELVSEYKNKENITKNISETKKEYQNVMINNIEIPNKPYQRNVLREMSLSQTSPIGINRTNTKEIKEDKSIEMIKDLEESLNIQNIETEQKKEASHINIAIKNESTLKIKQDNIIKEQIENQIKNDISTTKINSQHNILESYQDISNKNEEKKDSEKYLEEVSRKLAEAEVPDGIERTNYEIKQEEDAIISYKELMEKKDSIKTIDEEDAVISIEKLMNRTTNQEELENNARLYNLGEEEENESFIKELKQFRNDL